MKKILVLLLALMLVAGLAACGPMDEEPEPTLLGPMETAPSETESPEPEDELDCEEEDEPTEGDEVFFRPDADIDIRNAANYWVELEGAEIATLIYEIGDTSAFEQFEVTITDFEITRRFETTTFRFEPNAGNRFAVVHLTLTNTSTEGETLLRPRSLANDTRATLIHEDGTTLNPTNIHSGRSLLGSRIEAGESFEGFLVFEIEASIAETGELNFMLANNDRGSAVRYQVRLG